MNTGYFASFVRRRYPVRYPARRNVDGAGRRWAALDGFRAARRESRRPAVSLTACTGDLHPSHVSRLGPVRRSRCTSAGRRPPRAADPEDGPTRGRPASRSNGPGSVSGDTTRAGGHTSVCEGCRWEAKRRWRSTESNSCRLTHEKIRSCRTNRFAAPERRQAKILRQLSTVGAMRSGDAEPAPPSMPQDGLRLRPPGRVRARPDSVVDAQAAPRSGACTTANTGRSGPSPPSSASTPRPSAAPSRASPELSAAACAGPPPSPPSALHPRHPGPVPRLRATRIHEIVQLVS